MYCRLILFFHMSASCLFSGCFLVSFFEIPLSLSSVKFLYIFNLSCLFHDGILLYLFRENYVPGVKSSVPADSRQMNFRLISELMILRLFSFRA